MNRHRDRHDLLHQVASSQAGLVTAAQLREIGIATSTASRRSRAGGMWSRVLPGIHLVTGGEPDRVQREVAALLYAGAGAILTGITALRYHDVRLLESRWIPDDRFVVERVHVLIPHERRRQPVGFVDVERTHSMPSAETRASVPVAPAARALCDAARRMRSRGDVLSIVTAATRLGMVSGDELREELNKAQRRGSRFFREALDHAAAGAWSGWEGRLRELLAQSSLPEPLWNPRLLGPDGAFIGIPDAWIDDVGLAVEVDSREFHSDGDGWRRTLERQARYASVGVISVPVTPTQIRDQPDRVLALVRGAYDSARRRPRPAVRAVSAVIRGTGSRTGMPWAG